MEASHKVVGPNGSSNNSEHEIETYAPLWNSQQYWIAVRYRQVNLYLCGKEARLRQILGLTMWTSHRRRTVLDQFTGSRTPSATGHAFRQSDRPQWSLAVCTIRHSALFLTGLSTNRKEATHESHEERQTADLLPVAFLIPWPTL